MKSELPLCISLLCGLLSTGTALCEVHSIDPDRSAINIRVLKSGLFSAFAHNHDVQARGLKGEVRMPENPGVEFRLDTRGIKVLDLEESAENRAEIQQTMEGPKVLDIARYPEIRFRSTTVSQTAAGAWDVSGDLALHGQTKTIRVRVRGGNGHYTGETSLKQRDFGIEPISLFGGTVKVKDEIQIKFDIYTRP